METQHQMECEKYQKELERLRGHLVQVEEQYTQEALQADHRETQLRQKIRLLEEGAARNKSVDIQQRYICMHTSLTLNLLCRAMCRIS